MLGRITTTVALALGTVAIGVGPALAASPHFIHTSATGPSSSGTLSVNFKEAGLGDNTLIDYTASANSTADYACINHGDNHPQASNKETVSGPVTASGTFSSGKNGTISATLTLYPPSAGSFSCPNGQNLVLASVSYTGVSISDTTNQVTEDIAGTFSRVYFTV
jgi:hypothetical protein